MNLEQNHNKQDFRKASLTDRYLTDYITDLNIPEGELEDPNMKILDLGSGIQQELARQAEEEGYQSKIVSLDPKLSLGLEEDLSKLTSPRDRLKRTWARKNLPDNTLAATAQNLPFKDSSFDRVYALWSVPGYIQDLEEVKTVLKEIIRVVKDGGIVRAAPLIDEHVQTVKDFLSEQPDLEFTIDEARELLTIKKKEK